MPVPVQLTVQLTIKVAGWDAANHSVSQIDQGTVIMKLQHDLLAETGGGRPRLLIVQPLVGIGDMVWHKPWIDHLAAHFDVILACKPTAKAPVLFNGTEGIIGWISIERSLRGKTGRHDGPLGLLRLAAAFRASNTDHVLIMHHSATYALAARLAGIRNRWGYGIGGSRRWLNCGACLGRDARYEHPTRKLARFASMNGFGLASPSWRMPPTGAAQRAADSWCDDLGIPAFRCDRRMGFATWWSWVSARWMMNANGHRRISRAGSASRGACAGDAIPGDGRALGTADHRRRACRPGGAGRPDTEFSTTG
jgi:hypothetical protein